MKVLMINGSPDGKGLHSHCADAGGGGAEQRRHRNRGNPCGQQGLMTVSDNDRWLYGPSVGRDNRDLTN